MVDATHSDAAPPNAAATGMSPLRRRILAAAVVVLALVISVGGALATSGVGDLNIGVERIVSWFANTIDDAGNTLPLGFAFVAGMASAFNPCGFPLLPTYLGLFLSEQDGAGTSVARRLSRSLVVGATVTVGFVLLFAAIGVPINLGAQALSTWLPWIALGLGVALIGAGGYLLAGGTLYTAAPERLGARLGMGDGGVRQYFVFGLAYGLASLSCTLPIFLVVIGTSITTSTIGSSLGALVLYGLGMGTVILALTVATGLFKTALAARLRGIQRYVEPIGTVALFLAGGYIVYYWLTIGGLLT